MIIRLKELRVIPALMALVFAMYNSLDFNSLDMQMASYCSLGVMLLTACASVLFVAHNRGVSRYAFSLIVLLSWIAVVTMLNGQSLKDWLYSCISIAALLFLFDYYRNDIRPILIGALIGFSLSIYAAMWQLITNPYLWVQVNDDSNVVSGFLLGGNYNQMGTRLLCGVLLNILCLKCSRWFWVPLIPLILTCIALLLMVQSMTSLVSLLLLLVFCCLPGFKFPRLCITGLISAVVLFQVLVCFNGKGIENNETATWFIVDVLGKDITFTNRTTLWDSAMRLFASSPLMGYGFPTSDWYYSNLASTAVGPHNLILGLMIYGGIPAVGIFVGIVAYSLITLLRNKDRYATALYAMVGVFLLMSLMEVYSITLISFIIVLTYYYGQSSNSLLNPNEQQYKSYSQHVSAECS
ncbi:MAG: O-antigen ligase family protein [Bacteroidaceae bacterium]|nr:O-antigen ligase family protein [Bacteroidaceae bacterium]